MRCPLCRHAFAGSSDKIQGTAHNAWQWCWLRALRWGLSMGRVNAPLVLATQDRMAGNQNTILKYPNLMTESSLVYWRVKLLKNERYRTEKSPPKCTDEFRERGFRLFRENRSNYRSDKPARKAIAQKLGCMPDSLRIWCQQSERDAGAQSGLSSADKDRLKALERENKELWTANEIPKKASAYFAEAKLDRPFRR